MRTLILVAALSLAACADAVIDPEDALEVRIDTNHALIGQPIPLAIFNRSADAVFVSHCNYHVVFGLEQRIDGEWKVLGDHNAVCLGIYDAGELRVDARTVRADAFLMHQPGEYRVRVYGRRGSDDFGLLEAISAPFTVRYPPD